MQYGVQGNQHGTMQSINVSGNSRGEIATISGLSLATMYTVIVAAENRAGTGDYSDPLRVETPDSEHVNPY